MHMKSFKQSKVDVSFIEKPDPDDPNKRDTILVHYGSFSHMENFKGGRVAGPLQSALMGGESTIVCNGGDVWEGNGRSKNMSQQFSQLLQMQNQMQELQTQFDIKEPKAGELKYQIFISLENLPATLSGTFDGTSTTQKATSGSRVDIEGIFKDTDTEVPINKTFNNSSGSYKLIGILHLRKKTN